MTQGATDRREGPRPASTFTGQVVLAVLVGVGALYPLYTAARFIGSDLTTTGEKFDGLGIALGGAMLVPVALAALATAWWWWRGRGRPAGWVALALAFLVVAAELAWASLMGFS